MLAVHPRCWHMWASHTAFSVVYAPNIYGAPEDARLVAAMVLVLRPIDGQAARTPAELANKSQIDDCLLIILVRCALPSVANGKMTIIEDGLVGPPHVGGWLPGELPRKQR